MKFICQTILSILAAAFVASNLASDAQTLTQSVELRPGWNAVWLEVEPPDRDPAVVFAGLPLASVWTWSDRISATDFIQNPSDAGWNRAQWISFFQPDAPEAPLSNLGAVLPQRAYLLKLATSTNVTWAISGRPVLRTPAWAPDQFNLRGFPVDPAMEPTFSSFFRASPAHYNATNQRLEQILHLSPDGQWTAVSPEDTMRRGEAYWVYTRGASDFVAPFQLELSSGNVLDFDAMRQRIDLTLRNRHVLTKLISIDPVTGLTSPLLLLPSTQPGQVRKSNAPGPVTSLKQSVAANSSYRLSLGIDRTNLFGNPVSGTNAPAHTNLVAVRDNEGTLFYVGVRALAAPAQDLTGLWLGTATITNVTSVAILTVPNVTVTNIGGTNVTVTNMVNVADSGAGTVPVSFPLRLLLHVDSEGQVSLLRDVTLIYTSSTNSPGTNAPTPGAGALMTRPSRLITDPAIVANLSANDLRNRVITGRHITAPHFDFALASGQFQLPLTGVFGLSNQISGVLSVPANLPTNPFLHRYHPDHGTNRAYAITRQINLSLEDPTAVPSEEGDQAVRGSYAETIVGLHKQPLNTSGSLFLRRISAVGTLNAP